MSGYDVIVIGGGHAGCEAAAAAARKLSAFDTLGYMIGDGPLVDITGDWKTRKKYEWAKIY